MMIMLIIIKKVQLRCNVVIYFVVNVQIKYKYVLFVNKLLRQELLFMDWKIKKYTKTYLVGRLPYIVTTLKKRVFLMMAKLLKEKFIKMIKFMKKEYFRTNNYNKE